MDITMPPPPYSLEDRKTTTLAEVVKSTENNPDFKEVLRSFKGFLNNQEAVKLSQILDRVSSSLETKPQINVVIEDPAELNDLESKIREGFDGLEAQLRKLVQASELESTMYREELIKAQQRDRARIEELEAIVKHAPQSGDSLDTIIQKSMEENLKIIGDHTVGQKQVEAKRALAILTGLTGKSLPPSTLLGREFVTIGQHAIHQGTSYDVFLGEYFTGEQIAIKVLRHRVDEVTAKKTHEVCPATVYISTMLTVHKALRSTSFELVVVAT
ncbi:hypothetical protein FRC10_003206 [Ceratobasidium sp. 414]|nr:hypothetical protein FRC10_003206 [Ceratobasidium sp. 414]